MFAGPIALVLAWILVAVLIGGLVYLAKRELVRRARLAPDPALAAIVPPVQKFAGFDPTLRERSERKRELAFDVRRKASSIESSPTELVSDPAPRPERPTNFEGAAVRRHARRAVARHRAIQH